ncbi:MAG: hypothetical protein MJY67_00295 [Bacteroidales bacterium]|nr:hypothetical protein [Bacteroidales bacterium]
MKKIVVVLALAALVFQAGAQTYVPKEGEISFKVLQTTKDHSIRQVRTTPFTAHGYSSMTPIDLDQAKPSHEFMGCGICMTDASCWLLSQMDIEKRYELLKEAFSSRGLNFSIARLNCGSSDYATELYNYNDHVGDVDMKYFSVERDEKYMIPTLKMLSQFQPDLFLFSSIWSAPGWMKDSGAMCGGALLDDYMPAFASYWAAYLKAYKERGIKINAITVQNEPATDQRGGCPATLISAQQEMQLASKYLPSAFKKAGLDTKIWVWDQNYSGVDRVLTTLSDPKVRKSIDAVAWHPYSGKPEQMREVLAKYPGTKMHLTERGPNIVMKKEQDENWWCDLIFGALNNGCSSYTGWNLLLDEDGQPNTGRFACGGLYEINLESGKLSRSSQWTVFRQFNPYVKRGAQVMAVEQPDKNLTTITFRNPDGSFVIVVSARENPERQRVQIKFKDQYLALPLPMNTWSMTTILVDAQ